MSDHCAWVDCQQTEPHEHADRFKWTNPGDPQAGLVVVDVRTDGIVEISEAVLAQLLTDAGWERTA